MSRQQHPPFGLRMPPDLHEQIKLAAARNRRSMNAEIVFHLERVFREAAPEQIEA